MPCQQHSFLRSEELNNFQHLKCIGAGVPCNVLEICVVDSKPHMQQKILQPLLYVGRCCAIDVYGRCYAKCSRWNANVADVIATICVEMCCVIYGWCYAISTRWNGHHIRVFILHPGVLNRTSSHTCGRWDSQPQDQSSMLQPTACTTRRRLLSLVKCKYPIGSWRGLREKTGSSLILVTTTVVIINITTYQLPPTIRRHTQ